MRRATGSTVDERLAEIDRRTDEAAAKVAELEALLDRARDLDTRIARLEQELAERVARLEQNVTAERVARLEQNVTITRR